MIIATAAIIILLLGLLIFLYLPTQGNQKDRKRMERQERTMRALSQGKIPPTLQRPGGSEDE